MIKLDASNIIILPSFQIIFNILCTFFTVQNRFWDGKCSVSYTTIFIQIDAAFTSDSVWNEQQWQTLSKIDTRFNCALGGFAMMSRKDSGFTAAWNVGLSKLKNTNSFTKFCEEANKKHGEWYSF